MIAAFTFEHGGRSYTCSPEKLSGGEPGGTWWWFNVSYDQQRYAPFQAASSDTRDSVKTRIIAYYEHRLWAREQPVPPRNGAGRPGRPPSNAAKPGVAAKPIEAK